MVALRGHEDLGLVLEPPERLRVHDPVAIALERRPHRALGLLAQPLGGIGPRGQRRQLGLVDEHHPILTARAATPGPKAQIPYEECAICACAAAMRAIGTRNGEHET
jgi:hypothetical protein